ncbi:MAG: FixH family protein [Gammaproteobacteria bacterium]|nr:FixH family protein [Gammaproteobacteria bacterium]
MPGNTKQDQHLTIWYREPYVWLLIAIPLATVIASVITARLALQTDDGLVVDDYYKQGLEINRVLERDRRTEELGIAANLQLNEPQHTFRLFLTGNENFLPPETITLSFLHATRGGFDRKIQVSRTGNYLYQADLPELVKGRWHIQMETGEWRVSQTILIE